ncbi:type II toxin-antitoxin system HipA family toxin [Minwuia sp.]|uniref:type II toxin-antitoxin system HipA family toxin n=1 Tax=Minwuia sp. TaxID=2493630 RepID=UPI003A904621
MTSDGLTDEAFVWIWLPGAFEPVVAGRLVRDQDRYVFNYGRSYLARPDAIAIYEPELPLRPGIIEPPAGMLIASALRDASPDAWGRRVVLNKLAATGRLSDRAEADELLFMLESGSDRIGALDFQSSSTRFVAREAGRARLDDLLAAAEKVEAGVELHPALDLALLHGSSVGGARPKALIDGGDRAYISKFARSDDHYDVVKAEFIAMRLAKLAGLDVAPVELTKAAGRDVLLIERFDRVQTGEGSARKALVSALTLLGLDEMLARYASYQDLAEIIRRRFQKPKATLHEIFGRLVFNILCGNTDDHARNHAAFWNGEDLFLTPAYDICPQGRAGGVATQAMRIAESDNRSQLSVCMAAAQSFLLTEPEAREIIERQIAAIRQHWGTVCDMAELSAVDRAFFWKRQFLNAYAFEDFPGTAV